MEVGERGEGRADGCEERGRALDGGDLLGSVGWEVELMVYQLDCRVFVNYAEVSRVRTCAEGYDLLLLAGVGRQEFIDECVNGRCSDVSPCRYVNYKLSGLEQNLYPCL